MNVIRLTLAVAWNEIKVLFRDRGSLALLLLLPLLIAGLINAPQIASWSNGEEEEQITFSLLLVDEDGGPYAEQVAAALKSVDVLDVQEVDSAALADRQVAEREVEAAVIIPDNFSEEIDAYRPTAVQVILDPTQEATVGLVNGILDSILAEITVVGEVRYGIHSILDESGIFAGADPALQQGIEAQTLGVIMTRLNEMRQEPAIAVTSQDMAGKTAAELTNIVIVSMLPGLGVLFAFFVINTLVGSFYTEKDQGSFRRLLAAPIPRGAIIAGKMMAHMVIVLLQVGILIIMGNLLFNMPIGDSPWILLVLILALALVVTAVGMFLIAFTRTEKQAGAYAMIVAMALGALGGCLYGIPVPLVYRTEGLLGTLSRLTPQGNIMDSFISVMVEGAGIVDVLPQIGAVLAMTVILYAVAVWRFRFE